MNLKRINTFTLFVLAIAPTSGCDPITGVERTVQVKQLPSKASVEAALRDVPEIKRVEFYQVPERRAFSVLEGKIREPAFYGFYFFAENDFGRFEVKQTKKGVNMIEFKPIGIGTTPRDVAERNRLLLDKVYASLLKHSPGLPSQTNMVEKLIRIR